MSVREAMDSRVPESASRRSRPGILAGVSFFQKCYIAGNLIVVDLAPIAILMIRMKQSSLSSIVTPGYSSSEPRALL